MAPPSKIRQTSPPAPCLSLGASYASSAAAAAPLMAALSFVVAGVVPQCGGLVACAAGDAMSTLPLLGEYDVETCYDDEQHVAAFDSGAMEDSTCGARQPDISDSDSDFVELAKSLSTAQLQAPYIAAKYHESREYEDGPAFLGIAHQKRSKSAQWRSFEAPPLHDRRSLSKKTSERSTSLNTHSHNRASSKQERRSGGYVAQLSPDSGSPAHDSLDRRSYSTRSPERVVSRYRCGYVRERLPDPRHDDWKDSQDVRQPRTETYPDQKRNTKFDQDHRKPARLDSRMFGAKPSTVTIYSSSGTREFMPGCDNNIFSRTPSTKPRTTSFQSWPRASRKVQPTEEIERRRKSSSTHR